MRTLINAVSARAGGGVSYLINLLRILPAICPDDQFLAVIPDIKLPIEISQHPNLELKTIPEASGNVFKRFLWENTALIDLCHSWKADLLYCVANIIPFRNPGIPVAVMLQNVAPLTPKVLYLLKKYEPAPKFLQMLLLQKLTLFAARKSHAVIALSNDSVKLLQKWVPQTRPEVAYHGLDPAFCGSFKKPVSCGEAPYLLFVSSLYVYKGLEYLVEAMHIDPELPRLFVAGRTFDSGHARKVSQRIIELNLTERITFLDAIPYDELPQWYSHATAMVSPSWCESSSIILLEAMACGCPVVAMNTGPMPEICGETGIYAEPFNAKSLAEAMRKAVELDRQQIKKKLVERASLFTWEKSMQEHARIFAETAKPGKSC